MSEPSLQAVVLAAGKGTRMASDRAKVLHPLLGLPLAEHVLRAVDQTGAQPVTVVVGYEAEAVEAALAGRPLRFVRQAPPRGTGHALQAAIGLVSENPDRPLLVVNGDLPLLRGETLKKLVATHRTSGAAVSLLTLVLDDPGDYGRVLRDGTGRIRGIVESRDASIEEAAVREINVGAYLFEVPPLLEALPRLEPSNAQGEYYLTDLVDLLSDRGLGVAAQTVSDPEEALGVNSQKELADRASRLRRRLLEALMSAGVAVEDPASTFVGPDVVVERDVLLRPFTILEGRTRVRQGARVGPHARLVDCEIGAKAEILDSCVVRESVVEDGASVGPFAHIRPDSRVGAQARVGNFVELKKTVLGAGSKAPHLSYLGDAEIGSGTNIGAGTITCNYDGTAKHKTRIGAGAFVGSDTTLVAPIEVGDGAYVGAGSTLTEDVPPGALALARARQVTKPGWAKARRQAARGKGDKGSP